MRKLLKVELIKAFFIKIKKFEDQLHLNLACRYNAGIIKNFSGKYFEVGSLSAKILIFFSLEIIYKVKIYTRSCTNLTLTLTLLLSN